MLVGDISQEADNFGFQLIQIHVRKQNSVDHIGAVVCLIESSQILEYFGMVEGLLIANREPRELPIGNLVQHPPLPTIIIIDPQHILLMDSLPLLLHTVRTQQCRLEEFGHPIDSLEEFFSPNIKVIVCFEIVGEGVVVAGVQGDEFGIFVVFGVFAGAHEQHVLEEVRQTQGTVGVGKRADTNRNGAGCFLGCWVLDHQQSEVVG